MTMPDLKAQSLEWLTDKHDADWFVNACPIHIRNYLIETVKALQPKDSTDE